MSPRFECQDCDFATSGVHMAETHERRRDDHEVYEIEEADQ